MAKVAESWVNKKGETINLLANAFANSEDEAVKSCLKIAKIREELENVNFILQALNGLGGYFQHTYELTDAQGKGTGRWRSYIAENIGKLPEPEANHPTVKPAKSRKTKVA